MSTREHLVATAIVVLDSPSGGVDVVLPTGMPFARIANGTLGIVNRLLDESYAGVQFERFGGDVAVPVDWLRESAGR